MSDQPFGDRHGPTPDEMRRAFDARTAIPPRPEPSRYDRLGPLARALVDDYDALDLAEMLVKAQDELAALRQVARGYCPHCGRGDAAPTVDDWEQQKQRADQAEATLARVREAAAWIRRNYPALTHANNRLTTALEQPAAGPTATQATEAATTIRVFAALHRSAEQDVSRVIALYERWCAAGPPPLGTLMSRWWDARLVELHDAIRPPAHDAGPTVAEAAANDRRWPLEREGE